MMMNKLIAENEQGAKVYYYGKSIKECINQFDSNYYRSGWQIHIEDAYGIIKKIIKSSFRKSPTHVIHNGYK